MDYPKKLTPKELKKFPNIPVMRKLRMHTLNI